MTRGGHRARTAAGRRAQVSRTPSAPPMSVLLSGPRVSSRLYEVPSGHARGRPRDGGGAGEPGPGREVQSCLAGLAAEVRGSHTLGVGRSVEPVSGGCTLRNLEWSVRRRWDGSDAFTPHSPLFPPPSSRVEQGGGCSPVASGAVVRALALRCL